MANALSQAESRFSVSQIVFNVTSGILLAGAIYVSGQTAKYAFIEKGDLYFVELPRSADGKYQKALVIDNFSTALIDDLEVTVRAASVSAHDPINISSIEQRPIAPGVALVKLGGVLPNRQSNVTLTSDNLIEQNSIRITKAPAGFEFRAKDRLEQSFFELGPLLNAVIMFVIYVAGLTYFDRRFALVRKQLDDTQQEIEKKQQFVEETKGEIQRIKIADVKSNLRYARRILNLSKENEFWHDLMQRAMKQAINEEINAKKLIGLMLAKCGIKPEKTLRVCPKTLGRIA